MSEDEELSSDEAGYGEVSIDSGTLNYVKIFIASISLIVYSRERSCGHLQIVIMILKKTLTLLNQLQCKELLCQSSNSIFLSSFCSLSTTSLMLQKAICLDS